MSPVGQNHAGGDPSGLRKALAFLPGTWQMLQKYQQLYYGDNGLRLSQLISEMQIRQRGGDLLEEQRRLQNLCGRWSIGLKKERNQGRVEGPNGSARPSPLPIS